MKTQYKSKQQGAALLVALVMLIVITLLAVSSLRGVALESRISANRAESTRLQQLTDAALREGEFRFYGPAHLRDKLEANSVAQIQANCSAANKLSRYGNNKPCLLPEMTDTEIAAFFTDPVAFLKSGSYLSKLGTATGWMPYRGLDWKAANYFVAETGRTNVFNSYRTAEGAAENEALNPEYGAALEGSGTYFFLVSAHANSQLAAQSTLAVIYLGLN